MRPNYVYHVVTTNGHGVHSREFKRCAEAKATAQRCAEAEAESPVKLGPFEIERVQLCAGGSRRYWMRRRSRWVLWDSAQNIDARRPDWRWPEAVDEESDG